MTDRVSMQELFDSQAYFLPKEVGLLKDFDQLWEKYRASVSKADWSIDYHKDLQVIADKYDLDYDMPHHMGKLTAVKGVGSSTVVH